MAISHGSGSGIKVPSGRTGANEHRDMFNFVENLTEVNCGASSSGTTSTGGKSISK